MKRLVHLTLLILLPAALESAEMGKPDLSGPEFQKRVAASYGILPDREPKVTEVEVALLEKIAPLIAESPNLAQNMVESVLADDKPVSAAFNHLLGNLYLSNQRLNEAETEFLKAIKKFPDFQRAWNGLGTLKMQQSNYAEAAEALARSVELGAADAQTYGMLGYSLLQRREYVAAEVAYNMALLRAPSNVRWLEGKARILAEAGRHEEALAATDELLRKDPGNLEYWRLQGNAHLALGNLAETARSLEIARLFGGLDASALYLLGNLYMKQEMPDHALGAYLAAIDLQPKAATTTLLNVTRTLLAQEQFDLARRLVATLTPDPEVWPKRDLVYHGLIVGRLAQQAGDSAATVASFEHVLEIDPVNVECLFRLAQVHMNLAQHDKARFYLEKIEGDTNYEHAAQLSLAKMLVSDGRLIDALVCLRKALRLNPSAEVENLYNRVRIAAQSQS